MNKKTEKWVILLLLVALLVLGISGCAGKSKDDTNLPNINVYDGSLSKILGCMFSPSSCADLKKAQDNGKTPEQEKEALEKKIAKLQAKFMEMYGETPEGDSNEEADKVEEKIVDPFQVVAAN